MYDITQHKLVRSIKQFEKEVQVWFPVDAKSLGNAIIHGFDQGRLVHERSIPQSLFQPRHVDTAETQVGIEYV